MHLSEKTRMSVQILRYDCEILQARPAAVHNV